MSSPSAPAPAPDPARVRLVLAAVVTTVLFASLGQTAVSPALPVIVSDLGGLHHISWVITAYLLAATVGAPIAGKLGDLFGRRVVLQGGILVFLVGAMISGLSQNMAMLVAGRAVQGLGGGSLIVVSMAAVADVLPPRDRGRAQGVLGAAFGISTAIGPLVGGLIVDALSWHWIFTVNVPVGLAALVALSVALPRHTGGRRPRIDYAGAALLAAILSGAVAISNTGGTALPWGSPGMLALLGAFAAAVAAFVLVERRAPEPVLPLSLFRIPTFLVVNSVGFLVGMGMFGTITFMPLFLQVVKDVTATQSGLLMIPMMFGLFVSSSLAGQVMSRTGRYRLMPILSTLLLAAGLFLLSRLAPATSLGLIVPCLLMVGAGIGPVLSIGVTAIQNTVPVSMLGVGTASANMFRQAGGALGTSAFGALFAAGLARNLAGLLPEGAGSGLGAVSPAVVHALPEAARAAVVQGFANALHPIFLAGAGVALLSALIATRLEERPLSRHLPEREGPPEPAE